MKKGLILLSFVSAAITAQALINLRFTPVDLTRDAKDICLLEVAAPKDNQASAKVQVTLKGKAPAELLVIDLSDADDPTLENFPKTGGVGLMFLGDFSKASDHADTGEGKPAAMLQVGTQWFALFSKEGKWKLAKDPIDLSTVWAGSAAMLAECVKYCLADPGAVIPTTAGAKFTGDEKLGTIPGKVARLDVVEAGKVIIRSDAGDRQWEFPAKKETKLESKTTGAALELVNDYDNDGVLDKIAAHAEGPKLLRKQTTDITGDTGELDYHGRSKPEIAGLADCDFNCDGLPDVLVSYRKGLHPLSFFNRGFGCFGLGRELALQDSELKGANALADGQQAAAFVDVNGDGSPDLLAVAPNGDLWVLYTGLDRKPGSSVTVTAGAVLVVTAREGKRSLGARRVGPGMPVTFWLKNPGPLDLEWKDAGGAAKTRRVVAVKPQTVELTEQ